MKSEIQKEFEEPRPFRLKLWQQVFFIGFLLFSVGLGVLYATQNPILFPTVILLGNFLAPVVFVVFLYENRQLSRLPLANVVLGFLYGGALAVFIASVLESLLISELTLSTAFSVGFIEELAKILPLFLIAGNLKHNIQLNGIILGVAIGMGFAALESTGYSFVTLLGTGGNLTLSVGVLILRGLLSPAAHGAWTGILAGVIFRESQPFLFRIDPLVLFAYLGVSALHGLWNGLPFILPALMPLPLSSILVTILIGGISLTILYFLWQDAKKRRLT